MLARIFATAVVFIAGSLSLAPTVQARDYDDRRGDTIECKSRDYRYTNCAEGWRNARLIRQTSDSRCIRGSTWGLDRRGLWVDRGCGGVFERVGGGDYGDHGGGGGWRPGADWDQDIRFRCASQNFQYNFCQVDVGRGGRVYIERQTSEAQCIEGRTWGSNRAGVWVQAGCEAVFVVERRWR